MTREYIDTVPWSNDPLTIDGLTISLELQCSSYVRQAVGKCQEIEFLGSLHWLRIRHLSVFSINITKPGSHQMEWIVPIPPYPRKINLV